jgi:hypothetical protein
MRTIDCIYYEDVEQSEPRCRRHLCANQAAGVHADTINWLKGELTLHSRAGEVRF